MNTTTTKRLERLEATRPALAINREAILAEVIARAEAMLAGAPWPPGAPSTNPDVIAHKARLIASIKRTNEHHD